MSDWEPLTCVLVQVGEYPRAYRATWEIRNGYAPCVSLEQRSGDPNESEWRSVAYYPREDAGAVDALNVEASIAVARFGVEFNALKTSAFSA